MARARNIKPSIFKNELLGEADPLLTILFAGLWCLADREGRLEDRPLRIKAEVFPYRDITAPLFNGYLTELQRLGFIDRYSFSGQSIIQVINFAKHQSPHKTERESELPENQGESVSCALTVKAPLSNQSLHVKESLIPDSLIPDSLIPDMPKRAKAAPKNSLDYSSWPATPSEQVLSDWVAMRKKLKADISQTVVNQFGKELRLAVESGYTVDDCLSECVTRGWRGFKAQWLRSQEQENAKSRYPARQTLSDRAAAAADAAFGSSGGVYEGDFARVDAHGIVEQPES